MRLPWPPSPITARITYLMLGSHSTLKNLSHELRIFTQRVWVVAALVALLFLLLIFRLVFLQVSEHETYKTLSKQNHLSLIPIEPTRGLIYDRNGVLLAENMSVFNLELVPGKIKNIDETTGELGKIIDISEDELLEFKKQLKFHRRYESVIIKTKLTEEDVAKFSVHQHLFPDVSINARLIRHYPFGPAFSHVLGYVGRINQNELANADESNYIGTNYYGKVGIEKYYESDLHGKTGFKQVEMDAAGRIIRTIETTDPKSGNNLHLTIDSGLEIIAERALGTNSGAIVAIDPNNGEILALVSNPSYDTNLFVTGISNKQMKRLQDSPSQPLFNRAIRGQYPPASTIKPMTALAGLNSGVITTEEKYFDKGYYQLENSSHKFRDWNPTGRGWVNLKRSIIESCDTYFYQLAHKLGIKRIYKIMSSFGFGEPTGIDMGEELPGLLPTPKWKRANQDSAWYIGDTIITGIGQGSMLSTPLQLAAATAALAKKGERYQPHLLLKNNEIEQTVIPLNPIIIKDPAHWKTIIQAMQGVIQAPRGTGFRFGKDAPYTAAAKTGTAQVFTIKQGERYIPTEIPKHLRDHSLFIGFAPVENPKIALAIIVENGHNSTGIAREIMDYYLLQSEKA